MVRLFLLAAALAVTVACASNVRQSSLRADQVGTPHARQTGYFAACGTTCSEEETRGSIRHEVVRDEVTVSKLAPGETCFEVIVRTESSLDEPFDQLEPQCELDGRELRAVSIDEVVTVTDYRYTGQVESVRAEGVAAGSFLGLSIAEPAELSFRVIERRGTLCCSGGARADVALGFHNPRHDYGVSDGRLDLRWSLY